MCERVKKKWRGGVMKRCVLGILAMLILLAMLLSAGCGGIREQTDDPVAGGSFSVSENRITLASYRHLAPGRKDAYYCSHILQVWEPLVTKDENGYPKGKLAKSWKMSPDGKIWDFNLRDDVYFHNGRKLTADDVIANFHRMKQGVKRSGFYALDINVYYPSLLKVEKTGEYSFRLFFKEPSINQLYKMIDFGSPVYAPECFDREGNFNGPAIGTGPYRIKENKLNNYVVLEKNDRYYGSPAHIREIRIRSIPNAEVRYSALKAGEIQGVLDLNAIPPFLAKEISDSRTLGLSTNKSTMIRFLFVNGTRFPFNDERMRQAVSLRINRKDLTHGLYLDYAVPTSNLLNYTSPYYKELPVEYDPEKARALARAVLQGRQIPVSYVINGSDILQKGEAEMIAYWLKDLGLDVTIRSMDYAMLTKTLRKGDYDIGRSQQGLPNGDPYDIFYRFMMPDGTRNRASSMGYSNKEVAELLGKAKYCFSEEKRRSYYDRIQEIGVREQPLIPLYNDKNILAYNKVLLKDYRALMYGIDLSAIKWRDHD